MTKNIILLGLILFCNYSFAQNKWFQLHTDSSALLKNAVEISKKFERNVEKLRPNLDFKVSVIKNTTPFLIFVNNDTVNLPFYTEVIKQQKDFFTEVSGGNKEGREVFGLFFNGFYLVHELGHSLSNRIGKKYNDAYRMEYDANILSILYWEKVGQGKNLEKCYTYAKKMLLSLKNPVPVGEDFNKYMSAHYEELSSDPYKYGYIQFSQFVEIYETKGLPSFDTYVKNGMNLK